MKKINYYLVLALAGATMFFASCGKEDEKQKETLVSFENVQLNTGGTLAETFTDGGITFEYSAEDFGGFACSSQTDSITAGYLNQFSVYGTGGASGSKFAVFTPPYGSEAFCLFADGRARTVKELKLTNSTYAYLAIRDGNDGFGGVKGAFAAGDYFKVSITGYAGGVPTGSVDYYLADFRDGKSYICNKWTAVNLASLGKVNKLTLTFDSSDKGEYGVNTPMYVCIDDIVYYE